MRAPVPPRPPRLAEALLLRLVPGHRRDEVAGDLEEEYRERRRSGRGAGLWYWRTVLTVALRLRLRGPARPAPARREFPGPGQPGETAAGGRWGDVLVADLRLALRRLRRAPGWAFVALSTVALGIGLNAVVLSLADPLVLSPLPYPEARRLALLTNDHTGSRTGGFGVSWTNLADVESRTRSVEAFAHFLDWQDVYASGPDAVHGIPAAFVTPGYFRLLGLEALVGRLPTEAENRANAAARVAVLGRGAWERLFGADPGVVGRTVSLNGIPYEVVGVLSDERGDLRYRWGEDAAGIFLPLFAAEELASFDLAGNRGGRYLNTLLRLRPGVDVAAAGRELARLSAELADEHPLENRGWVYRVEALDAAVLGEIRGPVAVLLAGSLLVLTLVSVNLVNLTLARALDRGREIAVRRTLGAGRGRLARQLLTESLVVVGLGGAGGLALAWAAVATLADRLPVELPPSLTLTLDGRVVAASLVLAGVLGLALGAAALVVSRGGHASALGRWTRDRAGGGRGGARPVLVVAEVALAALLLVGAGLMIESFRTLRGTPYGFDTEGLLLARLDFRGERYDEAGARRQVAATLVERGRALPGVRDAFIWAPNRLGHGNEVSLLTPEGRWETAPGERLEASRHLLRPGTLERLGLPLLEGRDVAAGDDGSSPPVALVSRTLARELWPGRPAVGQRLESRSGGRPVTWEVVGVVADAHHRTRLIDPFGPQRDVYFAFAQDPSRSLTLALRLERDEAATPAGAAVRALLAEIEPDVPVDDLVTMAGQVRREEARARVGALLVAAYAVLAVALASLGVFGLLAHAVRRQWREIGVRMALGASPREELARTLAAGARLTLVGTALGLGLAVLAGDALEGVLYGVDPHHGGILAGVALLVAAVGGAASALPAWRATRVHPADAIRGD